MGCQQSKPEGYVTRETARNDGKATQTGANGKDNNLGHDNHATNFTKNRLNEFAQSTVVNPAVAAAQILLLKPLSRMKLDRGKTIGKLHHLRNIFAVPFSSDVLSSFTPLNFPKSEAESTFLKGAIKENIFFEHLTSTEMDPLIKAFEKTEVIKDQVVIEQGSVGDYFYVIYSGQVCFQVDGKRVGEPVGKGASFGELALLYSCPRAATVTALEDSVFFRVDQSTFRFILQTQTERAVQSKHELLSKVPFLSELASTELTKLANAMTPVNFKFGQVLAKKGAEADHFAIVDEGRLAITDIGDGSTEFEDLEIGPGDHYGEFVLVPNKKRAANITALTDGRVFIIKRETFQQILGNFDQAVLRSLDKRLLNGIKSFKDTHLQPQMYTSLAALVRDHTYNPDTQIVVEGKESPAALYIVRKGKLLLESKLTGETHEFVAGMHFGEETMLIDARRKKNSPKDSTNIVYKYSVTALESCTVGVLTLEKCRLVFDTTLLGVGIKSMAISIVQRNLQLKDFKKRTLIGAGTFGQVWLVSRINSLGKETGHALKVQSKYELCKSGQAKSVVLEKNIMSQLKHPFLSNLIASYQDKQFVYMLMDLVQGGELYNIMHNDRSDKLPESSIQFYLACISEGLATMHRRGFVYRDLKPENVLINNKGYPIIVDYGFAKYVSNMTYTLCGTPLYLAPEVILNRGHNWGADHWSLGVLAYEMLEGETPFYRRRMDQMELFRSIVRCDWRLPQSASENFGSLLSGLIQKKPSERLGSLADGEEGVLLHAFFSGIDYTKLCAMEIEAPFVPNLKDPLDTSQFEDWSHMDNKLEQQFPPIKAHEEKIFESF